MGTFAAVRRRFEARAEPLPGLPDRWVVWDGLVGRSLSRLIDCDGRDEAAYLAARLNAAWRERAPRRAGVAAGCGELAAYLDGIAGDQSEGGEGR